MERSVTYWAGTRMGIRGGDTKERGKEGSTPVSVSCRKHLHHALLASLYSILCTLYQYIELPMRSWSSGTLVFPAGQVLHLLSPLIHQECQRYTLLLNKLVFLHCTIVYHIYLRYCLLYNASLPKDDL